MFEILNLTSEKGLLFLKQTIIRHDQTSLYCTVQYTDQANVVFWQRDDDGHFRRSRN